MKSASTALTPLPPSPIGRGDSREMSPHPLPPLPSKTGEGVLRRGGAFCDGSGTRCVSVKRCRVFLGGIEDGELGKLGKLFRHEMQCHLRRSRAKGVKRLKGVKSLTLWGGGKSGFFTFRLAGDGPHPPAPLSHCGGERGMLSPPHETLTPIRQETLTLPLETPSSLRHPRGTRPCAQGEGVSGRQGASRAPRQGRREARRAVNFLNFLNFRGTRRNTDDG